MRIASHVFPPSLFVIGLAACLMMAGGPVWAQSTASGQWDGSIGQPGMDAPVNALAVFDDGSGPALYAGGSFTSAGGVAAQGVARWNAVASTWEPVGGGIQGTATTLAVLDDGSGPALYAGGHFSSAGGVPANNVARWDGSTWSAIGTGVDGTVQALAVFDDGSGPAIYAGGSFNVAGGAMARRVARWDGASWAALGNGISGSGSIFDLKVFDDGSGLALYAAGDFTSIGGVSTMGIARWNGSSWSSVGGGVSGVYPNVYGLAVFDGGEGEALYAAGSFTSAGGVSARRIARWTAQGWSALPGGGIGTTGCCLVSNLAVVDDGTGPALYAGGYFQMIGDVQVNRIARFDGTSWSALGSGMDQIVHAISASPSSSEPGVYAGGAFTAAGGEEASHIARWGDATVSTEPPSPPTPPPALSLHPNPVSTAASVTFEAPSAGPVELAVYDLLGRRVDILLTGHTVAGRQTVQWEARGLSPGLYVIRLMTAVGATSRKVLVLR